MNNLISLIGRILFAGPLAVFGLFHFMNVQQTAGVVPSWLPFPVFWVIITGIYHIFFAIMVIGNLRYASKVSLIMGGLLFFYVLAIHVPSLAAGGKNNMMTLFGLLKDTSMGGAAVFASVYLKK